MARWRPSWLDDKADFGSVYVKVMAKSNNSNRRATKRKATKKTAAEADFCAVSLLENQLMSYFGDQDDAEGIAQIRETMRTASETRRAFQEGLSMILSNPDYDCARLVLNCANRRAASDLEGREWLERLRK